MNNYCFDGLTSLRAGDAVSFPPPFFTRVVVKGGGLGIGTY